MFINNETTRPMNSYPGWKYFLLVFILFIAVIYALPNLFGKDHAIQISGLKNAVITQEIIDASKSVLEQKGIAIKRAELEQGRYVIRFNNAEDQLKAKSYIDSAPFMASHRYTAALNFVPATPQWLDDLGANPMSLGLDLSGGIHFLMEVDMDTALEKREEQYIADFKRILQEDKLRYRSVRRAKSGGMLIEFREADTRDKGLAKLRATLPDLELTREDNDDKFSIRANLSQAKLKEVKDYAVQQNITVLRNRINAMGVAEPLIQRQGDRIIVQLPGVQDSAQAKKMIGKTVTLSFHKTNDAVRADDRIPSNSRVLPRRAGTDLVIFKDVILTGENIVNANVSYDENGRPQTAIRLDSEGASKMKAFSTKNVNNFMAVVLAEYRDSRTMKDKEGKPLQEKFEEIVSNARINEPLGASFVITGLEAQEAQDLAIILRSGALTAPIRIIEERTVGPSLGQENIDKGMVSVALGLVLVLAFMLVYYKLFGVFANVALAANLVLVVALMSGIGATLTLPGIAGIVLTVGMAVDANVLIFERIREELRDGSSPQRAIDQGYASAFSTIADANVTTLIAAIILFAIGTGPIKGFAVTLMLGIITSMFTAIMGTRAMANLWYGGRNVKKLSV